MATPPLKIEHFQRFWKVWPRKEAIGRAESAWSKYDCDLIVDEVVMAVEKQVLHTWKKKERQFIPLPASWLNARRWTDEVVVSAQHGAGINKHWEDPDPGPQTCPHHIVLNMVLLNILRALRGSVTPEALEKAVKHKCYVAKQWQEIWPTETSIDNEDRADMLPSVAQSLWELCGGAGEHPVRFRGGEIQRSDSRDRQETDSLVYPD